MIRLSVTESTVCFYWRDEMVNGV